MANEKLTNLKAMAYDLLANIDYLQKKLTEVNQEIAKTAKEEKENGSANTNSNS
jgi:hypothetical protein